MKTKIFSILVGSVLMMNTTGAFAQMNSDHHMMQGSPENKNDNFIPTLPGQDAFGAIQEIVTILESDSSTDWSSIDISTLRSHLVDMNQLIMNANVVEKTIDGGLEMVITGQGRALQAIKTMVLAHAPMINGQNGWAVEASVTGDSAKLVVTSENVKETNHIRGLGFFGLMVTDSHHQAHHIGLARGNDVHGQ